MPNLKASKKSVRSDARKRVFNDRKRRVMKDVVKETRTLAKEGRKEEAQKMLPEAQKAIDKAAKRGVIKKNTASRKKSRLTKLVNSIS